MQLLPSYDSQFITLFQFGNGHVRRHIAVDVNAVDYNDVEMVAIEKAVNGNQIDILPTLLKNDPLREIIFSDSIENKSPDLRINGVLWEVEKSFNSSKLNNLKHSIDEGSKQAYHVIILLSYDVSHDFLFRISKGRFKDHKNLQTIDFRYKGKYIVFTK